MDLFTRRALVLTAGTPEVTGTIDLDPQTEWIEVAIDRPTSLATGITWASGTQVGVKIQVLLDGQLYEASGRSSGGIRSANGTEIATYKLRWNLPCGYLGGSTGKRLGETRQGTFQVQLRFELLRGTALTSSVVVTSASAPLVLATRHNSVAFDSAASAIEESGDGVISFSITSTGSDRAALVAVGSRGTSLAGTLAITGGGETIGSTLWDVVDAGVSVNSRGYPITNQASGAQTLTSDLTATSTTDHFVGIVTMTGVNQTSPTGNVAAAAPAFASSPVSCTVTGAVAADLVVDFLMIQAAPTVGADQTERVNPANTSFPTYFRISTQPGSVSPATMSWTHATDTTRALNAVVFKAQATAALTGTATAGITEDDVRSGGKVLTVTLTDDTFVSDTNFPTVEATAESSVNTAGTSHAVTLPAGMVATDLILITMDIGSTSATLNALTDWTELLDEASANGLKILYYTGIGVPSNPTFTSSASTRSASIAWRISNADKTIAPQIGTTSSGSSATPDPPASATPGSTKNYLFITFYGAAGEEADDDTWSDTPPTNYGPTPPLQKACGTAGTNLGGMIAAAHRQLNTGSAENPGTFAKDVSAAWRAQTIMIHPELKFTNARAAMRDGIDADGSEANGWDARRSTIIPVANVARTSDTVATLTFAADGSFDITALNTLTHIIPASILVGGAAITATPTFTIATSGGAATGAIPPYRGHPMAHLLVR